jgi:hypothetical protein
MSYMKVVINPETLEESEYVLRLSDGAFVNKENNQEYIVWVAEGNTAEEYNPEEV